MKTKDNSRRGKTIVSGTQPYNLRTKQPPTLSAVGRPQPGVGSPHQGGADGASRMPGEGCVTSSATELVAAYTLPVQSPPDEMCSVCLANLQLPSDFHDELASDVPDVSPSQGPGGDGVVQLALCGHTFHLACVKQMVKASPKYLQCPICKTIHGLRRGNQPPGKMDVKRLPNSLPGYSDCGTIIITYSFQSGIQGPEHPNPGEPYQPYGFPRSAFLPDNAKGNKVLKLLQEAWRRCLIFTVGTSATTGINNVITWNDIHHKTQWSSNYNGHGYPDEFYLDRVLMELKMVGVTGVTTE